MEESYDSIEKKICNVILSIHIEASDSEITSISQKMGVYLTELCFLKKVVNKDCLKKLMLAILQVSYVKKNIQSSLNVLWKTAFDKFVESFDEKYLQLLQGFLEYLLPKAKPSKATRVFLTKSACLLKMMLQSQWNSNNFKDRNLSEEINKKSSHTKNSVEQYKRLISSSEKEDSFIKIKNQIIPKLEILWSSNSHANNQIISRSTRRKNITNKIIKNEREAENSKQNLKFIANSLGQLSLAKNITWMISKYRQMAFNELPENEEDVKSITVTDKTKDQINDQKKKILKNIFKEKKSNPKLKKLEKGIFEDKKKSYNKILVGRSSKVPQIFSHKRSAVELKPSYSTSNRRSVSIIKPMNRSESVFFNPNQNKSQPKSIDIKQLIKGASLKTKSKERLIESLFSNSKNEIYKENQTRNKLISKQTLITDSGNKDKFLFSKKLSVDSLKPKQQRLVLLALLSIAQKMENAKEIYSFLFLSLGQEYIEEHVKTIIFIFLSLKNYFLKEFEMKWNSSSLSIWLSNIIDFSLNYKCVDFMEAQLNIFPVINLITSQIDLLKTSMDKSLCLKIVLNLLSKVSESLPDHVMFIYKSFLIDKRLGFYLKKLLLLSDRAEIKNLVIKFLEYVKLFVNQIRREGLMNTESLIDEAMIYLANIFELRVNGSIENSGFVFADILYRENFEAANKDVNFKLTKMILKVFRIAVPFFQSKTSRAYYFKVVFLLFLKYYCLKGSYISDINIAKESLKSVLTLSYFKDDLNLMSGFTHFSLMNFICKELDLESNFDYFNHQRINSRSCSNRNLSKEEHHYKSKLSVNRNVLQINKITEESIQDLSNREENNQTSNPNTKASNVLVQNSMESKPKTINLNLKLNLLVNQSNNGETSSFDFLDNNKAKYAYFLKNQRMIYQEYSLHMLMLQIAFSLLLNPSMNSFNEEYINSHFLTQGKLNYLYILIQHVSSDSNNEFIFLLFSKIQKKYINLSSFDSLLKKPLNIFEKKLSEIFFKDKNSTLNFTQPGFSSNVSYFNNLQLRAWFSMTSLLKCLFKTKGLSLTLNSKLGLGAYSVVYSSLAFDSFKVAVKTINAKLSLYEQSSAYQLFNEVIIQENLKEFGGETASNETSSNFYDFYLSTDNQYLLLLPLLDPCPEIRRSEKEALHIFYQIVQQVQFLHSLDIIHFDIKLQNILEHNSNYFLSDFGESIQNEKTFRLRGTEYIRSPEMLTSKLENINFENLSTKFSRKQIIEIYNRQSKYLISKQSDIWSLGCLLYELVTGEMLFYEKDWTVFYQRVTLDKLPIFTPDALSKLRDCSLITKLLEFILVRCPQQRPDIESVNEKTAAACKILDVSTTIRKNVHTTELENNTNLSYLSLFDYREWFDRNKGPSRFYLNKFLFLVCHDGALTEWYSLNKKSTSSILCVEFFEFEKQVSSLIKKIYESSQESHCSNEEHVNIEKFYHLLIRIFFKIKRNILIAKFKQSFLSLYLQSDLIVKLLGPILTSEQEMNLQHFIHISKQSLYKIQYSKASVSLVNNIFNKLNQLKGKIKTGQLYSCPCKANMIWVSYCNRTRKCLCVKNDNYKEDWACFYGNCLELTKEIQHKRGLKTDLMTWIYADSKNVVIPNVDHDEPVPKQLEYISMYIKSQTNMKQQKLLNSNYYKCICVDCRTPILFKILDSSEVAIPLNFLTVTSL